MANDIYYRISQANERCLLVIIIDGLDKLFNDSPGSQLSWLPLHLPKNVKIVVSTSDDEPCGCLSYLRQVADLFDGESILFRALCGHRRL